MKQRQANYELLRILAMMMVVSLHFLGKGGLLPDMAQEYGVQGYAAWFIEALCVAAVDIYVLISGYFLVEAEFRPRKLASLWLQILFYSLGVPLVCVAAGILPAAQLSLDRLFTWVFPILREHYWFATSYVLLYLFSPFLGRAARQLERKQFRTVLACLLGVYCISSSILPFDIALDRGGYDVTWFVCLYLTAAYLRLYGIPEGLRGRRGFGIYLGSSAGILVLSQFYRKIYLWTGKLEGFVGSPYRYNHVLCLLSAAALFGAFSGIKVTGKTAKWICAAASGTFGVYLLHENEAVRYLWPKWLGADRVSGAGSLVFRWIAAVAVVMTVGILVELGRGKIYGMVKRTQK